MYSSSCILQLCIILILVTGGKTLFFKVNFNNSMNNKKLCSWMYFRIAAPDRAQIVKFVIHSCSSANSVNKETLYECFPGNLYNLEFS